MSHFCTLYWVICLLGSSAIKVAVAHKKKKIERIMKRFAIVLMLTYLFNEIKPLAKMGGFFRENAILPPLPPEKAFNK